MLTRLVRRGTWVLLGAALAFPHSAGAKLVWSSMQQLLVVEATTPDAHAEFTFKNTGERAITIASTSASCGCTTAMLAKKTYEPGESGRLAIVVRIGAERRELEEYVYVQTDEPGAGPQRLQVTVRVQGAVKRFERILVEPVRLEWAHGAGGEPKVVRLTARPEDAIRPIAATVNSDNFSVELRRPANEAGNVYELVVTPRAGRPRAEATIAITTNSDVLQPEWFKEPPLVYHVAVAVR